MLSGFPVCCTGSSPCSPSEAAVGDGNASGRGCAVSVASTACFSWSQFLESQLGSHVFFNFQGRKSVLGSPCSRKFKTKGKWKIPALSYLDVLSHWASTATSMLLQSDSISPFLCSKARSGLLSGSSRPAYVKPIYSSLVCSPAPHKEDQSSSVPARTAHLGARNKFCRAPMISLRWWLPLRISAHTSRCDLEAVAFGWAGRSGS